MLSSPALHARLQNGARAMGIDLSDDAVRAMLAYGSRVLDVNQSLNLTRIVEPEAFIDRHLLDSLSLLARPEADAWLPMGGSLADIGTGAGFPGIPLAIARPDARVFLFDALRKKIDFVRETCASLRIVAECAHGRAEDFGVLPAHRERYDLVVSRAVANSALLCEWSLPFAKRGGTAVFYKGPGVEAELVPAETAAKALGGGVPVRLPAPLPHDGLQHEFIVIAKLHHTPASFPRKPAQVQKKPWA